MWRTALALFLFGAIVGNGYNSLHAFMGAIPITDVHSNPLMDWSSYLLFGFAGVSIGMLTIFFDKNLRKESLVANWKNAIASMLLLGVFYFLSACMFISNSVILMILIGGFILSSLLFDRHGYAILAAVLVAIFGTAAEVLQVHYHSYYYARPEIFGVTYWLPFLYGISSITTGQLARALTSRWPK
ncbi:MAG: hypothetical protein JWO03_1124 [Bacteroidetes bacterium]|nr:hypothetical protein [Bacteroidota bacterium]